MQVTCVGQIIAAVVADSKAIARRAAKLVKVSYEELDAIITLEVTDVYCFANVA